MFKLTAHSKRLVLGTAQLGMKYGIANRTGQPDLKTAEQIIQTAWKNGICEFDTAQAYGESETILGRCISRLGIANKVSIISKFDPDLDHLNRDDLMQALEKSLSDLKVQSLHGLLLHKEELFDLWDRGLGEILSEFISSELVQHVGVSVYSPEKAIRALKTDGISIVQFPSNVLDRRFERAGVFRLAEDNGKQIYVRSVFLQGLIIMDSKNLPANMRFAFKVLKRLEALSQETGLSKQDLALGYVRQAYPKTKVVFGVETPGQIRDNLKSWERTLSHGCVEKVQEEFGYVEERILNPALWPN